MPSAWSPSGTVRICCKLLNGVAQSIIEDCRGRHGEFDFVWRRERVKNFDEPAAISYAPIETMNNTAWQRARIKAGLGDLHVHDLRHTVGMRLREAGVPESTISDLLWHSRRSMTQHYSLAQLVEPHAALERIREPTGQWNKSLATLRREAANGGNESPKSPPSKKKGPGGSPLGPCTTKRIWRAIADEAGHWSLSIPVPKGRSTRLPGVIAEQPDGP